MSYALRRDEWFVLAGEHRQRNFCVRFHKREDALAGFYAVYEQAQAQAFRPAVLMSSLTLSPFAAPSKTGSNASASPPAMALEALHAIAPERRPPALTGSLPKTPPAAPAAPPAQKSSRTWSTEAATESDALVESVKAYLANYPNAKLYTYVVDYSDVAGLPGEAPLLRIVLDQRVFFDTALSDIRPEGEAALDQLAKALKQKTGPSALFVAGHTDSRGPDDYNLTYPLAELIAQPVRCSGGA